MPSSKEVTETETLIKALQEASARAAKLGIDITRSGTVRELIVRHECNFEAIRRPGASGDALDGDGKVVEIKTSLVGGTCQLGRVGHGEKAMGRLDGCDFVVFAFFSRVNPLQLVAAYKVAKTAVDDTAKKEAEAAAVQNLSISEAWASRHGESLIH